MVVVAYLCGSLPVGVWVGRWAGVDVRRAGSGNIGATNVARTVGKRAGLLTLFADVAKGALPDSTGAAPVRRCRDPRRRWSGGRLRAPLLCLSALFGRQGSRDGFRCLCGAYACRGGVERGRLCRGGHLDTIRLTRVDASCLRLTDQCHRLPLSNAAVHRRGRGLDDHHSASSRQPDAPSPWCGAAAWRPTTQLAKPASRSLTTSTLLN